MKHLLFFLLSLFTGLSTSFAQPGIIWENTFGGTNTDRGTDIVEMADGNYLALGNAYSMDGDVALNHGDLDFWLFKLDQTGQMVWQKSFGGSAEDMPEKILPALDGNYFVLGTTKSINGDILINHGNSDLWLLKVTPEGDILWQKSYGGTQEDGARNIIPTSDGNYMLTGYSLSSDGDVPANNHGDADLWVIKIRPDGTILWSKLYGGNNIDIARHIVPTSDNGYIIAGFSTSTDGDGAGNHGLSDSWVLKIDSIGTIQWKTVTGGTSYEGSFGVAITADGGYLVFNSTFSTNGTFAGNHGGYDYWVYKLNLDGNFLWQKFYGGSGWDIPDGMKQLNNGNCLFFGEVQSTDGDAAGNDNPNAWLICIDQSGTILWKKPYGGSQDDIFTRIKELSDGSLLVIGSSSSNDGDVQSGIGSNNNGDVWVVHLSAVTGTSSPDLSPFALGVSPNPASNYIQIEAPENLEQGTISIWSMNGSLKLERPFRPGRPIDVSMLPAGSYVIRLEHNGQHADSKFLKR